VKTTPSAFSVYSDEPESADAARAVAQSLLAQFGERGPKAVLVYATMNHDQTALLQQLRSELGSDTLLLGCSTQGVVSNDDLTEDGFAVAAMGFGGDELTCAAAFGREVQENSREKGRQLAKDLVKRSGTPPRVILVSYDPLCGLDVENMLAGMAEEVDCLVVGGASGQPWGPPKQTFQYWGEEVFSHGVIALALAGDFKVELGICHGTAPTGLTSIVTKSDGNRVLEIDGQRAVDVWRETTGCREEDMVTQGHMAAWAMAIEMQGAEGQVEKAIRGAFGFEQETGAVILQAPVAEGSRIALHHRTVEKVLSGTRGMADQLKDRLTGRKPWAVLGFECAARTFPFLGETHTRNEHEQLRSAVAPGVPWLGMMAWGEVGPCAGRVAFHNYTYPLLVLTD
jgi:hypothetical protein